MYFEEELVLPLHLNEAIVGLVHDILRDAMLDAILQCLVEVSQGVAVAERILLGSVFHSLTVATADRRLSLAAIHSHDLLASAVASVGTDIGRAIGAITNEVVELLDRIVLVRWTVSLV